MLPLRVSEGSRRMPAASITRGAAPRARPSAELNVTVAATSRVSALNAVRKSLVDRSPRHSVPVSANMVIVATSGKPALKTSSEFWAVRTASRAGSTSSACRDHAPPPRAHRPPLRRRPPQLGNGGEVLQPQRGLALLQLVQPPFGAQDPARVR